MPVYDDAGVLQYTLVERESQWTPEQVALVLGVRAFERMIGPHGQPMDEAMSPDADPSKRDGTHMYVAGVPIVTPEGKTEYAPVVDWAARAQEKRMEAYRKSAGDGADLSGLVFPVQKIERR